MATLPHYLHPSLPMERSEVTPFHTFPHHVVPSHIILYHVISCHLISCQIFPYLVLSWYILPYLPISCPISWHTLKFLAELFFWEAILSEKSQSFFHPCLSLEHNCTYDDDLVLDQICVLYRCRPSTGTLTSLVNFIIQVTFIVLTGKSMVSLMQLVFTLKSSQVASA